MILRCIRSYGPLDETIVRLLICLLATLYGKFMIVTDCLCYHKRRIRSDMHGHQSQSGRTIQVKPFPPVGVLTRFDRFDQFDRFGPIRPASSSRQNIASQLLKKKGGKRCVHQHLPPLLKESYISCSFLHAPR